MMGGRYLLLSGIKGWSDVFPFESWTPDDLMTILASVTEIFAWVGQLRDRGQLLFTRSTGASRRAWEGIDAGE